jgi:hypothetical protein
MVIRNLKYLIEENHNGNGSTTLLEILALHIKEASKLKVEDIEYQSDEEQGIYSMFVKDLLLMFSYNSKIESFHLQKMDRNTGEIKPMHVQNQYSMFKLLKEYKFIDE